MIGSEEWKTFQQCDTELAMIRLPEEVLPYLRKVWTELCNLHVGKGLEIYIYVLSKYFIYQLMHNRVALKEY